MFAICIDSSHQKGMGHFFKMMNFLETLRAHDERFVILINDDKASIGILRDKDLPFTLDDLGEGAEFSSYDIIAAKQK
jgi:spore coat polysaccharide biosynthesis predicted glycosyltransferase SpsG